MQLRLCPLISIPGFLPRQSKMFSAAHGCPLGYVHVPQRRQRQQSSTSNIRTHVLIAGSEDVEAQLASHDAVHESPEKVCRHSPEDIEGAVEEFNSDGRRFFWTKLRATADLRPLDDVTGGEMAISCYQRKRGSIYRLRRDAILGDGDVKCRSNLTDTWQDG